MAKRLLAVAALVLITSCGSVHISANLPAPSPPTAALEKWKDFPASANPRPIIAFGDTVEYIPQAGFPNDDRKRAWLCNRLTLATGLSFPVTPLTSQISAAQAYAEVMAARGANSDTSSSCASFRAFVITRIRLASAGFPTDRGMHDLPAWLFDVPEVNAYIGHLALPASALWGGGVVTQEGRGAQVSADGMTLKVGVSNPEAGPCGNDYTASAAESSTAVAVAVKQFPHLKPGETVACDLVLRAGYVEVKLLAPLGGRVLVDETGAVGVASS